MVCFVGTQRIISVNIFDQKVLKRKRKKDEKWKVMFATHNMNQSLFYFMPNELFMRNGKHFLIIIIKGPGKNLKFINKLIFFY